MKISVVFPSVMYREGPSGVKKLMQGIEAIGYDELDVFDHVVMGILGSYTGARRVSVG